MGRHTARLDSHLLQQSVRDPAGLRVNFIYLCLILSPVVSGQWYVANWLSNAHRTHSHTHQNTTQHTHLCCWQFLLAKVSVGVRRLFHFSILCLKVKRKEQGQQVKEKEEKDNVF